MRRAPSLGLKARVDLADVLRWRVNAGLLRPAGIEDSVRCWLSAQGWRAPPPLVQDLAELVRRGIE